MPAGYTCAHLLTLWTRACTLVDFRCLVSLHRRQNNQIDRKMHSCTNDTGDTNGAKPPAPSARTHAFERGSDEGAVAGPTAGASPTHSFRSQTSAHAGIIAQ